MSQVTAPPAYVRPVEKVVVATPVHVPFTLAKTWPLLPVKSEEVATAEGAAEAPVTFARTELAAMAVKETAPPAYVSPVEKVVVAVQVGAPEVGQ